jgi:hypothetical protein
MKWLSDYRMKLVLIEFVTTIALIGGNAKADYVFGEPINLGPTINTSSGECVFCFSVDGLEMYFGSNRPGVYGIYDLYVTTRETTDGDWGTPVSLGSTVNSTDDDAFSSMAADGLSLYFSPRSRPGGYGGYDIWVTTRPAKDGDWGTPVNLGPIINSPADEIGPRISTHGLELYFFSDRPGGYGNADIWVARRATINDPWGEPTNLGPVVNGPAHENSPFISADSLSLFFCDFYHEPFRSGGFGNADMWATTRASVNDPWRTPVNLGPIVNSPGSDAFPVLSPDGFTLYFSSARPGGFGGAWGDIYEAPIIPIVDLNCDGVVDATDMCIVVEHWGESYSLCDIGPMAWGDGVVDVEDLKVLAKHLFTYPGAVAYWKLDEAGGEIACDSIGVYDGVLSGVPTWEPTAGMVGGALQFDGTDDFISTDFVLNPTDGPFSVYAWINGSKPGQSIVSQEGAADWLKIGTTGNLMTELKGTGRSAGYLFSETVITDGQWHRVGLVWDGSHRILCVDGVMVAEDTQDSLGGSDSGLYIGAGKLMQPGTYFSGLIDDVRIYNRAVSP